MEIIKNSALLITTKQADVICNLIPKSKVVDRRGAVAKVLVHWGNEEWQILRNLNVKNVPHPIEGRYEWPGFYKPMSHQKAMASFMASHHRCYNLSTMGTAKTAACAWAADYLMMKKQVKRALIICPLSIMDSAWRQDLFKTVMHRKVGIAHGTREVRRQVIHGDYEFVVINCDGIKIMFDELVKADFDLIIVDELTYFKNATSDRSKALQKLIKSTTRVWGLTGSPAAKSPDEAYGLAKIVRPDTVNYHFGRFKDTVMKKISNFRWVPKADAKDKVFALLQPAIRFTKEECLDLPGITYTSRDIPMSKSQEKYYKQLKQEMAADAAGETIVASNAATLMNKLLQVATGSAYSVGGEVVEFDIKPRYNELVDVIDNTDNKVIVFAPFKHILHRLEDALIGDGYSCGVINGEVSLNNRTRLFDAFQTQADPKVILIQPQAASHGVTLTAADTIVWWGPTLSTETYIQANARADRNGQKNKVTVIHFQSSAVEKKIFKMLETNIDLHQAIVDLYKQEAKSKTVD